MELTHQNGAVVKNETTKATNTSVQNGVAKKDLPAVIAKPQNGALKPAIEPKKQELPATVQPAKEELALDARLKLVSDLHRRSVQRMNLMTRMRLLEEFEIALQQDSDELDENPYQGCKLIIRDDKNHDFVTTNPRLIRMVSSYVKAECTKKLSEIESSIIFPNA